MRTRIGTRLMLGAGTVTSLVIGIMGGADHEIPRRPVGVRADPEREQVSETIKSSTHYEMSRTGGRICIGRSGPSRSEAGGHPEVRLFNRRPDHVLLGPRGDGHGLGQARRGLATPATPRDGRWRSWTSRAARGSSGPGRLADPRHHHPSQRAGLLTADCHAIPRTRRCWGCWM